MWDYRAISSFDIIAWVETAGSQCICVHDAISSSDKFMRHNHAHFHRAIISQRLNMYIPSDIIARHSDAADQSEQRAGTRDIFVAPPNDVTCDRKHWRAANSRPAVECKHTFEFRRALGL